MPARKPSKARPTPKRAAARAKPAPAAKPAKPAKPAPPPPKRFLVRCTFLGEDKKQRLEGAFRFVCEAADATQVTAKLSPAVRRLRRLGELPARCQVYVEFVLELADLPRGVVADFERWESDPRRFQHGCIAFSDTCAAYDHPGPQPAFRFGKATEPAAAPAAAVDGGQPPT